MVDKAPMPTAQEAYEAKFRLRIIKHLSWPPGPGTWTVEEATDAANNELENLAVEDRTDDPEADADECMSYWDCDEDPQADGGVES
jgi:hypothetical protein